MTDKKSPERSTLTVAHIIVMVSDLEASCRFYTELGLAPLSYSPKFGQPAKV